MIKLKSCPGPPLTTIITTGLQSHDDRVWSSPTGLEQSHGFGAVPRVWSSPTGSEQPQSHDSVLEFCPK